jgi:glutaredoxin
MDLRRISLAALVVAAAAAHAQTYKVIGANGRVEYTDRPPATGKAQRMGDNTPAGQDIELPFELRQVVLKYPVTLYTTNNCGPCDRGRSQLQQRGVPYTEKSVLTGEDSAALSRLEGSKELPVLRIGGQQIKGYSQEEWGSYLDAAGYPAQSKLPGGYKFGAATPLVPRDLSPAAAKTAAAPASAPAEAAPEAPAADAPGRFRF